MQTILSSFVIPKHICISLCKHCCIVLLQVCEYNVPYGKKNRGMMVCQAYCLLKGTETEITEDELKLARILGWCIEWVGEFSETIFQDT